jgi:hypothetical protein
MVIGNTGCGIASLCYGIDITGLHLIVYEGKSIFLIGMDCPVMAFLLFACNGHWPREARPLF